MRIEELDKNFAVKPFNRDDVTFYDVRKPPFKIYGLYNPETEPAFIRLPLSVSEAIDPWITSRAALTSGGRVRFKTNSPFIAIRADMPSTEPMSHMPLTGSASFSVYFNKNGRSTYYRTYKPPFDTLLAGEGITDFVEFYDVPEEDMRDITIYFPLYAEVTNLYIGLQDNAVLLPGDTYKREKPVVFYGSSITQGGCASQPGNSYPAFLSRRFDFDFINLGFSGGADASEGITAYIRDLDMSMFVYDYDHNALSVEYLQNTHEKMFRAIRAAHPDMPIIMMSAPNFDPNRAAWVPRRKIIFDTFMHAVEEGDKNVYFIDGERLFGGDCRDACTMDGCHPNDLGFYRMADAVGATMEVIYSLEGCRHVEREHRIY